MKNNFVAVTLLLFSSYTLVSAREITSIDSALKPEVLNNTHKFEEFLAQMNDAVNALHDYTCEFQKHEWKHKQLPKQKIFLKYRDKPLSIYMKWIGKEKNGQEIIWRPDWNQGRIRAHSGGWTRFIKVNLDPFSSQAMTDSRHPITHAGFKYLMKVINSDLERIHLLDKRDFTIINHGIQEVCGENSWCFEMKLPKDKDPHCYCYKVFICRAEQTKLPSKIMVWDWEGGKIRLIEDYTYSNIQPNPGLDDHDFDPKNPEYNF